METPHGQSRENETVDILLRFIQETKVGKFTEQVPATAQVTYQRMEIQEQEETIRQSEQDKNELILFGIS